MKTEEGVFSIKIDLEKAYDKLEWGFIRHVLLFFQFLPSTVKLIMNCISSFKIAILVNGSTTDYFQPSRDIR